MSYTYNEGGVATRIIGECFGAKVIQVTDTVLTHVIGCVYGRLFGQSVRQHDVSQPLASTIFVVLAMLKADCGGASQRISGTNVPAGDINSCLTVRITDFRA